MPGGNFMRKFVRFIPTLVVAVFLLVGSVALVSHIQKFGPAAGIAGSDTFIRPRSWPDLKELSSAVKAQGTPAAAPKAAVSSETGRQTAPSRAAAAPGRKTVPLKGTTRISGGGLVDRVSADGKQAVPAAVVLPDVPADNSRPSAPGSDINVSPDMPSPPKFTVPDMWGASGIQGIQVYEYGKALLNDDQRAIYDQLRQAVQNIDKTITVTTPCDIYDFCQAYEYYLNDHVEIFYLHGGISINADKSGELNQYSLTFNYDYSADKIRIMRQTMGSAAVSMLDSAVANLKGGSDDVFEKEMALHDALIRACSYKEAAVSNPTGNVQSFTAYGAFVDHYCVCDGYARAMKLLLNAAGIRSLYVTGTAVTPHGQGNHAWNMVDIPDTSGDYSWYYLDPTFDDPILYRNNVISYAFFNFTSDNNGMGVKHILGTYDYYDPSDSQNYETLPAVG